MAKAIKTKLKKTSSAKTPFKMEWDLGLLYNSEHDPALEADMAKIESAYEAFEKKYRGVSNYLTDEAKLFEVLTDYQNLLETLPLSKPINYFQYRKDLKSTDRVAEANINIISERLTKNENKVLFFELALSKISVATQKQFLESKKLAPFHYFLERLFLKAKHDLTEAEEKIMSRKSLPSYELWVNGTEKMLGGLRIPFGKKQVSLAEALNLIPTLPKKSRRVLHESTIEKLKELGMVAENELNAIIINKKINDELRHFETPYDQTLLSYENDRETLRSLRLAVKDSFNVSQRFYKIKSKMLGIKPLTYAERNIPAGKISGNFKTEKAVAIVKEAFSKIDPMYAGILDRFLKNGQVDFLPQGGKTSGAYCSGNLNAPTFVLLNHVNSFDSVMTLAHEMGHAIHTELSKESQRGLYKNYSTATAEVASTLFEQVAFDSVFETLSSKEKVVALHNKIQDDIQTIFRQIACFNFEVELHDSIRKKGSVSHEDIAALMNTHMKSYLGETVKLTPDDGYFFVHWSHLRRFFYVYSYAFGQLVSKALYGRLKKDKTFSARIETFLRSGGSDTPENIFKKAGVNVTAAGFWKEGIQTIEEEIKQLKKLVG
ncbi:MAG: hypothetical protein A2836_00535 [Candidatus Taylorbacteria bacterium RIFCSPHIGHO2_01_FULL_45_63]|uniref:Oligoendopeptidase F n=1 Tax=Candidatus Taylorbacteria bacterium RIFCSPHIGHO2_02_FULL_45_35 TaxID=1802311 RepID=A0A1G2MPD9_9BACT|nr:MAG: hypothetical protein A2836_00535 [Candidatus Taylorbacteria bacterium RIFCSPHIGHO2_01_FULL_45_63]OHA25738.1 MAG: hypothetical protein A3D56_03225 [Candidatus Taylorbacteria bacterium RIFCSPHIGHO2_02_FULL_45_35]OHA34822.1 MAG: hypothetical protein A3A22_00325 [Candidatus Taylorbacteria bacterium RIFCSPLOWO2_01_FULL_45_34b]